MPHGKHVSFETMKTLAIFGASGKTGQLLTEQALKRGFAVRALCRNRSSITVQHPYLNVLEGALTLENCREVMKGCDAVLCVLGQRPSAMQPFCADATAMILQAMVEQDVKRIVCLTGAMVGDHNADTRSWFIRQMVKLFLRQAPDVALDRSLQESHIAQSLTEWTLVKPPRLTDAPARTQYQMGESVRVTAFSSISRADVAECMLNCLESRSAYKKFLVVKA
jgi:putative NADH-flavin reductase